MQKIILLIDDDEEEFYILKLALELTGIDFHCVWVNGLEQATQIVKELRPDFIFIDINMPRHNGIACLKKLKQLEPVPHSVFVMYSSYISEADKENAMLLGANFCIRKEENVKSLFKQLNILFNDKTQSA